MLVERITSYSVEAVVLKLLEKDPDDRYQTAAGLRDDLSRLDALAPQHP